MFDKLGLGFADIIFLGDFVGIHFSIYQIRISAGEADNRPHDRQIGQAAGHQRCSEHDRSRNALPNQVALGAEITVGRKPHGAVVYGNFFRLTPFSFGNRKIIKLLMNLALKGHFDGNLLAHDIIIYQFRTGAGENAGCQKSIKPAGFGFPIVVTSQSKLIGQAGQGRNNRRDALSGKNLPAVGQQGFNPLFGKLQILSGEFVRGHIPAYS